MASTRRWFGLGFAAAMIAALLVPVLVGTAPAATSFGDRVGTYDPASASWNLDGLAPFLYGNPGDRPMMGDWDCDGEDTPGLHRAERTAAGPAGKVYLRNSNTTGIADVEYFFGDPGDVAFAGDFNGDGCDSVGLFRPSTGQVFLTNLLGSRNRGIGAAQVTYTFPALGHDVSGARAIAADFDGNGIDSLALHLPGTATVLGVRSGAMTFGDPGDQLVAGAWDGGAESLGVYRADSFLLAGSLRDVTASAARSLGGGGIALSWSPAGGPAPRSGETCNGLAATIVGTANADVINGTANGDVIVAKGGNDVVGGKNGADTICGGDGDDILNGDRDNDTVFGEGGVDNVNGGDDNDELHGGPGADIITGDKHDDTMFGDGGDDNMNGGSGNDYVDGGDGADLMSGSGGNDTLLGRNGPDVLNGGPGTDTCDLGADGASKSKCENNRPVANPVAVNATEDGPVVTAAFAGTDDDGDSLTYAILGQPSEGSVVNNNNGTFTFDPGSDFQDLGAGQTRDVTFQYTASDALSTSDPGTVTVTVTGVDDAPVAVDDTATVTEDDPATAIDVLANDTDIDGGPKTIASVTQPANGTVVNNGSDVTYEPDANYCNDGTPTDDFTYTLNGGSIATVAVTVSCVDDPPVAVDDTATVSEDSGANAVDVLANDTDIDGGPKTIASATQPANGTVVVAGDNLSLTYEPDANYCNDGNPTDDFTYTLNGGSTATVAVTVSCDDDPPVAVDDTATVAEDSGANAIDVLANDTDIDGGPKSVASVTQPANGTVVNNGSDVTYEPDANYCNDGTPTDDFTYTLTPGGSTATVRVTVTCVNDPVDAVNDIYSTSANAVLNVAAPGVLGNDIDPDGDATAVPINSGVGGINVAADGAVTFDPAGKYRYLGAGESTTKSATYTATDGTNSDSATVTITINGVNDPPKANPQDVVHTQNATIDILLTGGDPDVGTTLTFSTSSGPSAGTLSAPVQVTATSATVTYTPDTVGALDSFVFSVSDGSLSASATVRINPPTNEGTPPPDPPVSGVLAEDDSVETEEDKAVTLVLLASSDAAGDLAFSIESGPNGGTLGTITPIDPDGAGPLPVRSAQVTYTPPAATSGTFTFDFRAEEAANAANFDTATVTIVVNAASAPVNPVNPTVEDLTKTLEENETITFSLDEAVTQNGTESICDQPPFPCGRTPQNDFVDDDTTDPNNDATDQTSDDPARPDLVSVRVGVTAALDNVAFEVRYEPTGFDSTTTRTGIVIDIDGNKDTGFPGVDAANNDSDKIGAEYLVNIGANLGANAEIRRWVSGNTFVLVATVPASILQDGHYAAFDLALLGGDDGKFNYKVTTQSQISPTPGFTGILDYMPNLGAAAARVDDGDIVQSGSLRYTVITLPAQGTLFDIEDNAISAGQTLLTPIVKYVAGASAGTFSGTFSAENTALLSTTATLVFKVVVLGTCETDENLCDDGRSP